MSHYSLWLLPAADQEAALLERMAQIAGRLGGERFAPHLTIQGDLDLPLEKLSAALAAMARSLPLQCWPVQQVEVSEHFFRSLYLRFADEPAFAAMQEAAQALSRTAAGLSPYPHLSLSYGPAHPDKAGLRQQLADQYLGREICFDRLAVTNSSQTAPIADWQCLAQHRLGQA